jgi:hypothetical protein
LLKYWKPHYSNTPLLQKSITPLFQESIIPLQQECGGAEKYRELGIEVSAILP